MISFGPKIKSKNYITILVGENVDDTWYSTKIVVIKQKIQWNRQNEPFQMNLILMDSISVECFLYLKCRKKSNPTRISLSGKKTLNRKQFPCSFSHLSAVKLALCMSYT